MLLLVVEGEADSGRWMKRDVGICQHDERVLAFLLRAMVLLRVFLNVVLDG